MHDLHLHTGILFLISLVGLELATWSVLRWLGIPYWRDEQQAVRTSQRRRRSTTAEPVAGIAGLTIR